jgi:hypothetical protein
VTNSSSAALEILLNLAAASKLRNACMAGSMRLINKYSLLSLLFSFGYLALAIYFWLFILG